MPLHINTPLYENAAINQRLGKQIHFKMDCYQPVGSFKIRGIGRLCEQAVADGKTHLISSSGGNAGYAAAYAGNQLGVQVTVVVPNTTSEAAIARMREQGAEVIVHGDVWNEADTLAQQLVAEKDGAYIHPFDHPIIWDGHASLISETIQQMDKPDVVVVAVGGGGLLAGVLTGMHANAWQDVPVLAVETEGAASFAATARAGTLTRIDRITSVARTLGALEVASTLVDWLGKHSIQSITVSDASAIAACVHFADDFRAIVEPACGAALSLIYDQSHTLSDYDNILMVVCGGAGVSMEQLMTWKEQGYAKS